MNDIILVVAIVSALGSLACLAVLFLQWIMQDALSKRVAKLEALQENTLTHGETRQIYERLSGIEAIVETQSNTMLSIQKHLLEKDK